MTTQRQSWSSAGTGAVHPVRTVIAHDVDEHAHNLTNWEQRYDQISAGHFCGMLVERRTPSLQIFKESTSQSTRQSCRVWPDAFWFGLQTQPLDARINGRVVGEHMVMVRPGNCEFELVTPDNYEIFGVVIQRGPLLSMAEKLGCQIEWAGLAHAELVHVAATEKTGCLQQITDLLALTPAQHLAWDAMQQDAVMMALLAMLDTSAVEPEASQSFVRRRRIVANTRDYVGAHQDEPITVPMLCNQLHVSRRTLQYCFEEVLGISPMTYLRTMRLNGVRRQLRRGQGTVSAVGDAAAAWGFGNFSQFSSDYKKLFGESPSTALKTGMHSTRH